MGGGEKELLQEMLLMRKETEEDLGRKGTCGEDCCFSLMCPAWRKRGCLEDRRPKERNIAKEQGKEKLNEGAKEEEENCWPRGCAYPGWSVPPGFNIVDLKTAW